MAYSYVFGGDTGETQESLRKRRQLVAAMMAQAQGAAPRNVGEGINAIGQAIAGSLAGGALRRDEAVLRQRQADLGTDLASAIDTGGGSALAYDPGGSSISADTSAAANLQPADREGYAMDYLVGKGLQPYQAAGVVGNLIQESSLNTGARNRGDGSDGSDSIGVGQWNGNRASGLRSFAANGGRNVGDLDTQLDYVLHELDGPESAAGKALRSARNVDEATAAMIGYERPAGWSADNPSGGHGWGNRIGHAQRLFQAGYGARADAADSTAPAPVPSTEQAVTNALAMQGADRNSRMVGGPVQVASLDPSIGVDTALAYNPRGNMDVTPAASEAASAPVTTAAAPVSTPPAALPPGQKRIAELLARMPANVQQAATADAGFDGFAQTGGTPYAGPGAPAVPSQGSGALGLPDVPAAPSAFGPGPDASPTDRLVHAMQVGDARTGRNPAALLRVLQSPYASDEQRQLAGQLLNHLYSRQEKLEDRAYEENNPAAQQRARLVDAQIAAYGAKSSGFRTLTADEANRMGLPAGTAYQVGPDGKVDAIGNGKGQSITIGGGENKQVFDAVAESAAGARSAVTGLNAIREARKAIDAGGVFGAGADTRLGLQKVGAYLGITDPAAVANTETFRAAIAPQVAALLKSTVGSANISNSDRDFAEKAAGGSITLEPTTIKRLLGIMEKASTTAVEAHRSRLDKVYPAGGQFERERALFGVDMPDMDEVPPGATPAPTPSASPPPAATAPRRARNPQTGAIVEFRNGQWVPAQ